MPTDARIKRAALLMAVRNYKNVEAPFGVIGGFDVGPTYISTEQTEIDLLLYDLRVQDSPTTGDQLPAPDQEWPTVEEVAAAGLNTKWTDLNADQQASLTDALAAARAQVTSMVVAPWGVA